MLAPFENRNGRNERGEKLRAVPLSFLEVHDVR